MMNRRTFLCGLSLGTLAAPLVTGAQQAEKVYRIGYLVPGPTGCPPTTESKAFRAGLNEAGYIEGRNVIVDRRCFPTAKIAGKVLDDLLKPTPDILVSGGNLAALVIRDRAPRIPVVFANVADPVGLGMVQSLARPGGSMTGLADLTLDLTAKRVQILTETLPGVRLVSALSTPDDPGSERFRSEIEQVATTLGLQVRHFMAGTANELPGAFEAMKKDGLQAFVIMQAPLFWTERARIANLAVKHRLPGMYPFRTQVEEGGFVSYGADQAELYRRAAGYVAKILKGTRPSDLPVEQPLKFELVINLKTARALGVTIPPSLLLRADQIIE
jgi:ABC-type uncharacterized transport system substrate-binding protein